ncbi:esterase/lipase family protein [Shewanella psychrotolerans]|uniref:esterase/lipase family protein n=1 Tax=Shewanella psychrotolerans TaxID=2864206 RepID=UPI001C6570D7|nr:alpha/beta fold hydrolase [Shewanella psychrotolerans]QYK01030.1 lipase [Shewanella psychrotolerans]
MKLVLIHGIFNTGHVMGWMRKRFEQQGYECIAPSIAPFDGRHGIEYAAAQLKLAIETQFGHESPIVLIGFSMGGVVARYYLQCLGGASRTKALFSISSPHRGSYLAYLPYPSKAMRQLRPNSQLLQRLDLEQDSLRDVALYSYRTPMDFTIVPSRSSHWDVANNKVFMVPLHLSMIFSRRIVNEILALIPKG